jgi:hypothetical protein
VVDDGDAGDNPEGDAAHTHQRRSVDGVRTRGLGVGHERRPATATIERRVSDSPNGGQTRAERKGGRGGFVQDDHRHPELVRRVESVPEHRSEDQATDEHAGTALERALVSVGGGENETVSRQSSE